MALVAHQTDSASSEYYVLVETAIGKIAVAWNGQGVTRLRLPEANPNATERRMRWRGAHAAEAIPPWVGRLIDDLQSYAGGRETDFTTAAIDLHGVDPFCRSVYQAARSVAWGRTITYGELAREIGRPEAARDVGQALGRNPVPLVVPCHRIVAAGNRLGGFSAYGGVLTKQRLLALEGAFANEPTLPGIC